MSHLFIEEDALHHDILEMARLIKQQLSKLRLVLESQDKSLAKEIRKTERKIDAQELKIDRDCENVLALYTPVAIDLRFILAALKINTNLERLGDNIEGIAEYIIDAEESYNPSLIVEYRIYEMLETCTSMLDDAMEALEKKDANIARQVFEKDDFLDKINKNSMSLTINFINKDLHNVRLYLLLMSIVRKFERIGDQIKNIAEEVIFYQEASVLRHKKSGRNE